MKITWDKLFSNWIFIWFFIFYYKIYDVPSPLYLFLIGIIVNLINASRRFYNNKNIIELLSFLIVITLFKGVPAYLIKDTGNEFDLRFTIYILITYTVYMFYTYGSSCFYDLWKFSGTKTGPLSKKVQDYLRYIV